VRLRSNAITVNYFTPHEYYFSLSTENIFRHIV